MSPKGRNTISSPPAPLTQKQKIGQRGEQIAARYLIDSGFEVLASNWRYGRYELDLVARRQQVLHVVEVKCRRDGALTSPEEALTPAKCKALLFAAQQYVARYDLDLDTQFDLIAVEYRADGTHDLRYIPHAFVPHW